MVNNMLQALCDEESAIDSLVELLKGPNGEIDFDKLIQVH